jgi:hypothetical protein
MTVVLQTGEQTEAAGSPAMSVTIEQVTQNYNAKGCCLLDTASILVPLSCTTHYSIEGFQ